jgi:hypothetical protein
VEVAVSRVEDVPDAETVLGREVLDAPEDLGESRPRNHPVLHVVVGRDPAHRRERGLAALPQERAGSFVGGRAQLEGAGQETDGLDRGCILIHLGGNPVEPTSMIAPAFPAAGAPRAGGSIARRSIISTRRAGSPQRRSPRLQCRRRPRLGSWPERAHDLGMRMSSVTS